MAKSSITGVGFNVWSPPRAPFAPREMIAKYKEISSDSSYNDYYEIPPEATHVSVHNNGEYYGTVTVTFSIKTEVSNPRYAKELAAYKKLLAKYEKDLKEWEEKKKEWDLEQAENELKMKVAQFKRLKRELGVE